MAMSDDCTASIGKVRWKDGVLMLNVIDAELTPSDSVEAIPPTMPENPVNCTNTTVDATPAGAVTEYVNGDE